MSYLYSDKNTLVWFFLTIYAVSALFILPNTIDIESPITSDHINNDRAINFASRLIVRIILIFPMILVIKNVI
jgi:hypothetical protein